jgi:elongation factor G
MAITLHDGRYHDVDSSEQAFNVCAFQAVQLAVEQAAPVILEPIMALEAVTPTEYLSAIIGDLNSRRARIVNLETTEEPNVIHADVPIARLFGYSTVVRSLSQGRAAYSMEPKVYAPVPPDVAETLII